MKKRKYSVALLFVCLLMVAQGQAEASNRGAQVVLGSGERGSVTFKFHAVFTPSGRINGTFFADNPEFPDRYPITGKIDCGWVADDIGVFGGTDTTSGEQFTVQVSDEPDGLVFGTKRPNCSTVGFGSPIPITEGRIRIKNGR